VSNPAVPPVDPARKAQARSTPITDALVKRHQAETKALENRWPDGGFVTRNEWERHALRQAQELLDHARAMELSSTLDAERFRKIMNKHSPFIVRDVRRHNVHTYFISPELVKALDQWTVADSDALVVELQSAVANKGSEAE
jgi:hypothetical protein